MKKLISMLVLGMLVVSSVAAFAEGPKDEKPDNQTEIRYNAGDKPVDNPEDKPFDESQPTPGN